VFKKIEALQEIPKLKQIRGWQETTENFGPGLLVEVPIKFSRTYVVRK